VKFGYRDFRFFAPCLLLAIVAALAAFGDLAPRASAQALYTATQLESLSAWGGATGTLVNLPVITNGNGSNLWYGGRNLGISAGVNLRIWQFHGFLPSVEIRGTYPVSSGTIAGEKNGLAGIKIEKPFGRYHPYCDFFFGRSSINYQGRGYIAPNGLVIYQETYSNVLSPGVGVDIDLTHHFAAKLDAQLWHQNVPVTASGTLNSFAVTVGAIYRFDFNHPFRAPRNSRPVSPSRPLSTSP
jgi:hypothetical protein